MPISSMILKLEPGSVVKGLQEARDALDSAGGELILDFSPVHRIDASALRALEELAGCADGKAVRIVLHGVDISVYRVMKLMKLAPRFSFQT
jgi:anti-anti-sigma regulatory factor